MFQSNFENIIDEITNGGYVLKVLYVIFYGIVNKSFEKQQFHIKKIPSVSHFCLKCY